MRCPFINNFTQHSTLDNFEGIQLNNWMDWPKTYRCSHKARNRSVGGKKKGNVSLHVTTRLQFLHYGSTLSTQTVLRTPNPLIQSKLILIGLASRIARLHELFYFEIYRIWNRSVKNSEHDIHTPLLQLPGEFRRIFSSGGYRRDRASGNSVNRAHQDSCWNSANTPQWGRTAPFCSRHYLPLGQSEQLFLTRVIVLSS